MMNYSLWKYSVAKKAVLRFFGSAGDLRFLNWQTKAPMPVARRMAQAITVDDRILVFGGEEQKALPGNQTITETGEDIFEYDTVTDAWSVLDTMIRPRSDFWAFRYGDNQVYVIGGFYGWTPTNEIDVYNLDTKIWSAAGVFPTDTTFYSAVLVGGRFIYAIGGYVRTTPDDREKSGHVYRLDLQTNTTSGPDNFAPMPTPRASLTAVVGQDGLIYAMGGLGGKGVPLDTVEAYDPVANEWQTRAPMLYPRRHFPAVVGPNGWIYALGGLCIGEAMRSVEVYNPVQDSWLAAPALPSGRLYHAAVLSQDNRVFAVGGQYQEDCDSPSSFLSSMVATTLPLSS